MIALKAPWRERNGKLSPLKLAVFIALFIPAIVLSIRYVLGDLEPKAVLRLNHEAGDWTMRLLLLSLLITPIRKLAQWPKAIALRRMLGIGAFAYALAHFCLYIADQKFDLLHVGSEIIFRFYLTVGFVTLIGIGTLAATSTDAMIRKLGAANWNRLHKGVYALTALGIFHFFLQAKKDVSEPLIYLGLYLVLMLYRLGQKLAWPLTATVAASVVGATFAVAGAEIGWYSLVRSIDPLDVLFANFDADMFFTPSQIVAMFGLGFAAVYVLKNFKVPLISPLLVRAK